MLRLLLTTFLIHLSGCSALSRSGLHNHSEIHDAKNLIDALSYKLHLNLQTFQEKYENSRIKSNEYLMKSSSTKDEIKMLNKLKGLLNGLTKRTAVCETFYTNLGFIAAREIMIVAKSSVTKDFTISLQVNHRDLIDNDLALENGNDLRVYYKKIDEDCQPREIDRILKDVSTTKTSVLFKLQEDLSKSVLDRSAYYLVYGNKEAGEAKQNPENVYLFHDDFSDSNLEKKWQKNWGSVITENGVLKLKTALTPTKNNAEISVFVKQGHEWKDIEVELDLSERNINVYPGPFLRAQDVRIQTTSAWWFEYSVGKQECTMRPFKKNVDGLWLYRGKLTKPLSAGAWYHAKYRVVGDRFSHWFNNELIHDNVQVSSQWMITKGTLGLGCHTGATGCHTSYDNIKVTKYTPVFPTVSLGPECKVDLKMFHGLGTTNKNPATSCKQIHDISIRDGKLENGVYWIKTSAHHSVQTFCDLTNGGWTLIGKVGGFVDSLYKFWLIKDYNVDALKGPGLPSKVGCIDARDLATKHASTVMLSSGDNKKGIGSKWVQWPLPHGRESDSLWTHNIGRDAVSKAKMYHVTVKAWNGKEQVCYQNKYGIMPLQAHGGSYPSATYNTAGNTNVNDYCMAVGVLKTGRSADGWSQNGNGYDSAESNTDWPNSKYNHVSPYVTVWLK